MLVFLNNFLVVTGYVEAVNTIQLSFFLVINVLWFVYLVKAIKQQYWGIVSTTLKLAPKFLGIVSLSGEHSES